MCGIAGTIYKRDFLPGKEVKIHELQEIFLAVKKNEQNISVLLEKCWQYKSNINFLRYCKDETERSQIDLLCDKIEHLSHEWLEELSLIDKSKSLQYSKNEYQEYESLLDCHWFLSREINGLFENIKYFLAWNINQVDDSAIIFYKNLISVINAIDNRLEFRGRDSLGIAIQLVTKGFDSKNYKIANAGTHSESVYVEECSGHKIVTFVFKTANSIGSLGDNAKVIKELIKNNVILGEIIRGSYCEYGSIVIHTRWASVGEVSINNCHPISNVSPGDRLSHPLILASMNGDIYNYKEIMRENNHNDLFHDAACTTDCLAIPVALTTLESLTLQSVKDVINTFVGSFAIAIQSSKIPGEIILTSRGSQGLYIGISYDNIMFASDVYGLIESCRLFSPIKSGSILSISHQSPVYNDESELQITKLDESEAHFIKRKDLKTTNITTRDIDKGKFNHFLEKEIRETRDIVQKTIFGYLQHANPRHLHDYLNSVIIDKSQVPDCIIDRLKNDQIKKIIITGMGTCYTAAASIAMYMRDMLRHYRKDIQVEPHIASEGSAFYLKPTMNDTLVIVIAQSGTTVDTNVYVQMANERGALSLAIANKREGDVTFIVNGTLYIGSGRDIEIAVPSTKTYTAQVILGYILTLYFCCKLAEGDRVQQDQLGKNVELLRNAPELIDETFRQFDEETNLKIMRDNVCRYNSWYVVHDDSPNSVCSMEIRIKYSEGCYHTLPYMHIDQILENKVAGSFLTYMTNRKLYEIEDSLTEALKRNNSIIVIGHFDRITDKLCKFENEKRLSFINIPLAEPFFSFIPTIITGQLLSYYAALVLDSRKEYFNDLIDAVQNNRSIEEKWENIRSQIMKGTFNEGFSNVQFIHLRKIYDKFKTNGFKPHSEEQSQLIDFLNELYQFSRRPIDTIKHQAKTITVGAVRESSAQLSEPLIPLHEETADNHEMIEARDTKIGALAAQISEFNDSELFERMRSFKNYFIYMDGMDESYRNFVVNFLNEISNKYDFRVNFRPAKYYELSLGTASNDEFWIFITDGINNKSCEILKSLGENRYIIFDFSLRDANKSSKPVPLFFKSKNDSINYSLGCLYIVNVLMKGLLSAATTKDYWDIYSKEQLRELESAWDYVCHSSQIDEEVNYAAKIFLTKRNWKCIGSGVNYNTARFAANQLIAHFSSSCAFDVLENHKHIDISAEAAIFTFIANIWRQGYQSDVLSEIEKLLSHNNIPIIVTNLGDKRFDAIRMRVNYGVQRETTISLPIIRLPKLSEIYSFPLNVLLVKKIVDGLTAVSTEANVDVFSTIALKEPSSLELQP